MKKYLVGLLVVVFCFVLVGCGKKDDYKDYLGYQFSRKDLWGGELAITIRTFENDKLTWTYTDVLGSGESSVTVYNELATELKDGTTSFTVKGDENDYSFNYTGTLTLKDGKLTVKLTDGALEEKSTEGGAASYQVGPLEDTAKTITLTKVVDNS